MPMADMHYTMPSLPNTSRKLPDTRPKMGRITMYTSGCPKNQNRCCYRTGSPPSMPSYTQAP
jgi:hypothetical protein